MNNNTDLSTAEFIRHVPPPAALQAPPLAWMFPHVPVGVKESNRQPAASQTLHNMSRLYLPDIVSMLCHYCVINLHLMSRCVTMSLLCL